MTEIKLKDGEIGYEAVAGYIYRYWNHYHYTDSVLVKLAVSYNGEDWEMLPVQIASAVVVFCLMQIGGKVKNIFDFMALNFRIFSRLKVAFMSNLKHKEDINGDTKRV